MMNRRLRLSAAALIAGGTAVATLTVDAPAIAAPVAPAVAQARATGVAQVRAGSVATQATTSATHVTTRKGRGRGHAKTQRYAWERVVPATLPDGTSTWYPTAAVGIDDSGRVAGTADGSLLQGQRLPFVGGNGSARWFDVSGLSTGTSATAISPTGTVLGHTPGIAPTFLSWASNGTRRSVSTPESQYGPTAAGINSRGTVAGTLSSVKVGELFYGRPGAISRVPFSRSGNFDVTGISESGTAVATMRAPSYQTQDRYPEGVVFTASRAKTVRANDTTAIDAISPNGRYIVGRVGAGNWGEPAGDAAWLSTSRGPDRLRGAADFRPRGVTDRGVVVGSWRGHAAVWDNAKVTDLNTQVRGLPSGWVLTDAVAINKSGALAVNAKDASGTSVALKLTLR